MDKGISQPFGFGFGLLKKRSADALPVIFLPHPHDGQLHGMPSGFFQIEKADRNIVRKGAEEWAAFAVRDVRFRSFRDAEPIRKHFQNGPCDALFLDIAVNFLYYHWDCSLSSAAAILYRERRRVSGPLRPAS